MSGGNRVIFTQGFPRFSLPCRFYPGGSPRGKPKTYICIGENQGKSSVIFVMKTAPLASQRGLFWLLRSNSIAAPKQVFKIICRTLSSLLVFRFQFCRRPVFQKINFIAFGAGLNLP